MRTIRLTCPNGHVREVGPGYAGKKVVCDECGHVWKVPPSGERRRTLAPPRARSVPIAGVVTILAAAGGIVWYVSQGASRTNPPLPPKQSDYADKDAWDRARLAYEEEYEREEVWREREEVQKLVGDWARRRVKYDLERAAARGVNLDEQRVKELFTAYREEGFKRAWIAWNEGKRLALEQQRIDRLVEDLK